MPVKGVKLCGAKCRTKGGAPCLSPGMKNGRCRMHGGVFYRRETHGRKTLRAIAERKRESEFLRELKAVNKQIKEMDGQARKASAKEAE